MNPLDGWKPSVPDGSAFELGTPEYKKTEKKGIRELGKVGFVLVAGGLGERLGYSGAKVYNAEILSDSPLLWECSLSPSFATILDRSAH